MGSRLLEQLKGVARQRPWLPDHGGVIMRSGRERSTHHSDFDHLRAAARWLAAAQDSQKDGGIAGRYRLDRGWTSSYPETTGYLVPTFIALDAALPGEGYAARAARAIDFLLRIQLDSGASPGMEIADNKNEPSPFNTAQILNGLTAWHRATGDERAQGAGERAAAWLAGAQDGDGAFRRHTYLGLETTYTAHLSCWLAEWGAYARDQAALDAAERHLDWVLAQVQADGWIAKMGFGREQHAADEAFTHTIAYTLMGLLSTATLIRRDDAVAVVERAAEALRILAESEGRLPGVISHWQSRSASVCLTGNAQIALLWFKLHRRARNLGFVNAGLKAIDAIKATQQMTGRNPGITGAIAGSDPVGGPYIANAFPNWAAKFFIDALMEKRAVLQELARTPIPSAPELPAIEPKAAAPRAGHPLHTVILTRTGSPLAPALLDALTGTGRLSVVAENARRQRLRRGGLGWLMPADEAIAAACRKRGVALIETDAFDTPAAAAAVTALKPDLGIVADASVPPRPVLDAFRLGAVQAVAGMLPVQRGADASLWAMAQGETVGCSVHLIGEGATPLLARRSVATFGCRAFGELERSVERERLRLLAEVVRAIAASGALPAIQTAPEPPGPPLFPMHHELADMLHRKLSAQG